jgi:hypothetical protein
MGQKALDQIHSFPIPSCPLMSNYVIRTTGGIKHRYHS